MTRYRAVFLLFLLACSPSPKRDVPDPTASWEAWKTKRMEELKSKEGFLNLEGLFWLEEGEYTFGSDSSSDLLFPEAFPANSGVFQVQNGQVRLKQLAEGILIDSLYQTGGLVFDQEQETASEMTYQSYVWYVIERVGNIGIRLKDLNHPKLAQDIDIHFYEYNPELVVEATFRPYLPPKKLNIKNILDHEFDMEIEGQLQFDIKGEQYTLEPLEDGDFFIIFSDETSAVETYGSGRYMHVDKPGPDGKTIIDFNRSYNPPCAFTAFATCLIPPPENRLTLRIDAGELDYHLD